MKKWVPRWFAQVWPQSTLRLRVAGEYAQLRTSRHMLADLAIRNGLFVQSTDGLTLFDAGVAEGRRRAVLEILDMVRVDPSDLMDVTVRLAPREENNAGQRPAYLTRDKETRGA